MTMRLFACFALTLTTACASTEGDGSKSAAKVSISSVQMISDCPDEDPASPAAAAMEPGDAERSAESAGDFEQPCTQSTMQLSLTSDARATVAIQAVRLLSPEGVQLATLRARTPKAWVVGGYHPWDERLAPGAEVKASYKLSVPDWDAVDGKLGSGSSVGKMFVLEVDVTIDGRPQTVRSSAFPREEDHVIVT
jgi:hypothetical protein